MCLFEKGLDTSFGTTSSVQFSIVPLSAWLLSFKHSLYTFLYKFDGKLLNEEIPGVSKWQKKIRRAELDRNEVYFDHKELKLCVRLKCSLCLRYK